MLDHVLWEVRECQPADQGDQAGEAAADDVGLLEIYAELCKHEKNEQVTQDCRKRSNGDDFAQGFRSVLLVNPLQRQRRLHGLVIMKAKRHDDRGQVKAEHGWEIACRRGADSQEQQ